MLDAEIVVVGQESSESLVFRLTRNDGSIPSILSVAVLDAVSAEALWVMLPATITLPPPFDIVNEMTGYAVIEGAADYTSAATMAASQLSADHLALPLKQVTYGVVPPEWQQALPQHGPPPSLVHGRKYHVQVIGAGKWTSGSCTLTYGVT